MGTSLSTATAATITLAAQPHLELEGFGDSGARTLTYTLAGRGRPTVGALLLLANEYRVKPLREIARTANGPALQPQTLVRDGETLWAIK